MKAIGITATDTEFGKTVVSSCLAAGFKYLGFDMGVFKPAASGCVRTAEGRLVSEDAELLIKGAGLTMAQHDEVVPYVLEAALAPAEASKLAGVKLEPAVMKKAVGIGHRECHRGSRRIQGCKRFFLRYEAAGNNCC